MKILLFSLIATFFITTLSYTQKTSDNLDRMWETPEGIMILMTKVNNIYIGKYKNQEGVVLKDVAEVDGKWNGKKGDSKKFK